MITNTIFNQGFNKIRVVFEFEPNLDYQLIVYEALKDKLTDQMFLDGCNGILKGTTKDEWNKAYGFKGRPAIKDWVDAFLSPYKVKKTKYCSISGRNFETEVFSDTYLEQIQQKQGKIEQKTTIKKENRLDYIPNLKTINNA